jgi:hypothetical protein
MRMTIQMLVMDLEYNPDAKDIPDHMDCSEGADFPYAIWIGNMLTTIQMLVMK